MKKRLLGLLLVFTLVFTSAMPVFADYTKISDDADVQTAWEKYSDLKTALEGNDIEAVKAAYTACEEANGALDWDDVEVIEAADENFFSALAMGQIVGNAEGYYKAFVDDKNVKTAKDFVDYYGMDEMAEYRATVAKFIPDIDAAFAEAQAMMPSEDVLKVYDAYAGIQNALAFQYFDEDTRAAMEAMEAVLDIFNEMEEEDLAVLAQLLGMESAEAVSNAVFSDWVDLNILAAVDECYQAFMNEQNKETAQALVDYYEAVFPVNPDEAVIDADLVRSFFIDIDDVYAMAQEVLASDGEAGIAEDASEVEGEKAPETGDATSLLPLAALAAAGAAMVALRRRAA